jgi:Fe-S cluster assembly protein SufD
MAETKTFETAKATRPMTVQVLKTKAETALGEQFAEAETTLPGGEWLRELRLKAIGAFATLGLPHRRVEEWKYSDLRAVLKEAYPLARATIGDPAAYVVAKHLGAGFEKNTAEFVNGRGAAFTGVFAKKGAGTLAKLSEDPPAWLKAELEAASASFADGAIALNTALFTDGMVLDIADDTTVEAPLVIAFTDGDGTARTKTSSYIRNVIRIGNGAKVTLVELFEGGRIPPHQVNAVTQLIIGDGAEVTHVKLVEGGHEDLHVGKWIVRAGAGTTYRPFQMTLGAGFVRNELAMRFDGQNSTIDLGGAFLNGDNGHTDTTLVIDHAVPHCTSRELVKGVLDQRARGVFQGKVIVRPDAQKTDGKQMAQALMLSDDAEFDSKPELEIHADDVVCGHGSTSAEIDPDLVFYLRARGISREEAMALLVESFIGEAIDKLEHEALREVLMGKARVWLERDRARNAA